MENSQGDSMKKLTRNQTEIYRTLINAFDPLNRREIAKRAGVSTQCVTRGLETLRQRGLVCRPVHIESTSADNQTLWEIGDEGTMKIHGHSRKLHWWLDEQEATA
jgi:hypothetical protein